MAAHIISQSSHKALTGVGGEERAVTEITKHSDPAPHPLVHGEHKLYQVLTQQSGKVLQDTI